MSPRDELAEKIIHRRDVHAPVRRDAHERRVERRHVVEAVRDDPLDHRRLARARAADDVELRVRDQEALGVLRGLPASEGEPESNEKQHAEAGEAGPHDNETAEEEDLSLGLEREALRFFKFSKALDEGKGSERLPLVQRRLALGAVARIDRTTVLTADGRHLLADLHARLENQGEGLALAIAAQLGPGGGVAAFDGLLTSSGVRSADIRIERIPAAEALGRITASALEVADGVASGKLSYRPSNDRSSWTMDVELQGLLVHKSSIGRDWLPLPSIRLRSDLVLQTEDHSILLESGSWTVADTGGELTAFLGPLGADQQPEFDVRLEAPRLRLGRLLSALPDSLMPASWAEELQGTMGIEVDFEGLLHRREEWELDWKTDFSLMLLADGSLAQQVERLREPFEHVFPIQEDGRVITRTMGPEDDTFVSIEDVSRHLVNAVVSTEDSGFFRHAGFEEESIKEAMLENLREGEGRGGSTITQQLAKNLFLSGERTFARKLKEAVIAWRLESELPKDRILEIYLNIAEWGPGIFGAKDAIRHYYDRAPDRIRPEQAAFLASLLPSPVRFHGYYHPNGVTTKRFRVVQRILQTMNNNGRLNGDAFQLARGAPLDLSSCDLPQPDSEEGKASRD